MHAKGAGIHCIKSIVAIIHGFLTGIEKHGRQNSLYIITELPTLNSICNYYTEKVVCSNLNKDLNNINRVKKILSGINNKNDEK